MNSSEQLRPRIILLSVIFLSFLLANSSCSSPEESSLKNENTTETLENGTYSVSVKQFQSSGMKLGKLEERNFHKTIKANGVIDVPPQNQASVSSYFGGNVKELQLLTGERVKKGQTLFVLENPEYAKMQQDYLAAKSQLMYLKSDYERQKNLAQDNVSSQKNFLKAETDYTITRAKVESLSKQLRLMNIDPATLSIENISTTINIKSPIEGYITEVNISRGAFVNPSQVAVTIVDTDHLHLEINVFEKDLAKIKIGQTIWFTTQNDATQKYEATVHLINKTVDEDHRTIGIHGHFVDESQAELFYPGMYVEATIYTTSQSKPSLPQDAVVELDGATEVLVLESLQNDQYVFRRTKVETGVTSDGIIEILNADDFSANAEFLVRGAFNLITE